MGYDVDFIPLTTPPKTTFPVDSAAARKLVKEAVPFADVEAVKAALLKIPGCKPGPEGSVDYLGAALSYARLSVRPDAIHVENNCGPKDLLKIFNALTDAIGPLVIHDLQSKQLHDAASFTSWWAKPL